MNPLHALWNDLQRPAGGWTTGVVTLLAGFMCIVLEIVGYWPLPNWTANLTVIALLAAHAVWGAAGYYPRRFT
jgi:hypothetical protein